MSESSSDEPIQIMKYMTSWILKWIKIDRKQITNRIDLIIKITDITKLINNRNKN